MRRPSTWSSRPASEEARTILAAVITATVSWMKRPSGLTRGAEADPKAEEVRICGKELAEIPKDAAAESQEDGTKIFGGN